MSGSGYRRRRKTELDINRLTRRNTETEVFTDEVEITQKEGVKKMKGERGKKNVEE
jgi:hypothetical protein